ncbi:Protein of unknown function [Microbacterium sp. cf046]|uniref:LmeA family phospholipid-binding protein n=1 Tax=Microbacterium sp. cf046 TaxID=1761803 RepID=UPI0008F05C26|nr:DUF2993 domain-containing protein [Microbacterium sp. cf046]SFS00133.1 Protein of unknown function [Microbacterium sp. cf046]
MTTGDTQPTQPLPPVWTQGDPEPKKRRRAWPWLLALVIVVGLAIAAWFAGEWIARDIVTKTIRDQVVTQLSLPADQQIDVVVAGAVLPQLIKGSLDDVTVSSDDVALEAFVGDVTIHAQDIAIRGESTGGTATATVVLDQEQLRTLLSTIESFPTDSVGLAEPNVTMTTELSLFGITLPIGVALTPSAAEGDIVLTPAALQLAGSDISVDALKNQFGGVADAVLRDWTICIAQYIPAGVELTGIAVTGEEVVAELDIDPAIVNDTSLQETGVCE